ncbi:hypothetical protein [Egicoccus halophilus]|uniref:Uncharacterized protein n=1 Tax=Egicoccus halophilus TaxID=1670830 RepID=A0A8J3ET57_9ACTN|nr:hypothetical protein [Egicoccus halophilus]GGI04935.1 hypothetical protein GCM10011354_11580 [Egicoccus halophilus]
MPRDLSDDATLGPLVDALEGVDELAVAARVSVFEQVNDAVARELARLDEV